MCDQDRTAPYGKFTRKGRFIVAFRVLGKNRKCIIYYGLSYLVLTQEQVISMGQFEKQLQILIIGDDNFYDI